jgi:ketosteroid isomerase-like protein
VADRQRLIRNAFDALARGDLAPLEALFDPAAKWVAIPGMGGECPDRAAIVDRLRAHHENGRRFTLDRFIEEGDRVAVGMTIENPAWSSPVHMFKVLTFRPGEDAVVRMNDCIDESYALQVLAA